MPTPITFAVARNRELVHPRRTGFIQGRVGGDSVRDLRHGTRRFTAALLSHALATSKPPNAATAPTAPELLMKFLRVLRMVLRKFLVHAKGWL